MRKREINGQIDNSHSYMHTLQLHASLICHNDAKITTKKRKYEKIIEEYICGVHTLLNMFFCTLDRNKYTQNNRRKKNKFCT